LAWCGSAQVGGAIPAYGWAGFLASFGYVGITEAGCGEGGRGETVSLWFLSISLEAVAGDEKIWAGDIFRATTRFFLQIFIQPIDGQRFEGGVNAHVAIARHLSEGGVLFSWEPCREGIGEWPAAPPWRPIEPALASIQLAWGVGHPPVYSLWTGGGDYLPYALSPSCGRLATMHLAGLLLGSRHIFTGNRQPGMAK
jgi:hypothetical protein